MLSPDIVKLSGMEVGQGKLCLILMYTLKLGRFYLDPPPYWCSLFNDPNPPLVTQKLVTHPQPTPPVLYDRSLKDFKDKNKKSNCWKAIAEKVGQPVDQVKRRYKSIRTQFGKYLKSRKGKSGSGSGDVPIDPKYEHLRWLKNFIVRRACSGNFKPIPSNTSTPVIKLVEVSEDVCDSDDETNKPPSTQLSDKEDGDDDENDLDISVSNCDTTDSPISEISLKEKPMKPWVKKESRKRELEKTDAQLNRAMNNLSESIALHKKSAPKEKKMDEVELYVLSLANRLKSLDRNCSKKQL